MKKNLPSNPSICCDNNFIFSEYFTCENNATISINKKCDGIYDCAYKEPKNPTDLSDEKNCCKFH